jgi:hypothetical protein
MQSLLDGNQILLMIGRIPRTRIPKSATLFPAIRILRCLRPNLGVILITNGHSLVEMNHGTILPSTIHDGVELQ